MAPASRDDVRSLAVLAHVDHGKTSLVDALLWQSALLPEPGNASDAASIDLDLEREKVVAVMPRQVALRYRGTRIQLVDTPGQAAPGSDLDRVVKLAEGLLLVVDACEGPVPQTRFALRCALAAGLTPLVVINKVDRSGSRPEAVRDEVRAVFRDLEADESQQDFLSFYCVAHSGICRREPQGADHPMLPLLDAMLERVPAPKHDGGAALQLLVTGLDYDDFRGRMALGRVVSGSLRRGQEIAHCREDGEVVPGRVSELRRPEGMEFVETAEVGPGEIVAVAGIEAVRVGDTLADPAHPEPLPPIRLDEPAIAVTLSVNDSPLAGQDGTHVSADRLRERLWSEMLGNPAIRLGEADRPDAFLLSGRAELQIAILVEMMRREGFEMSVAKPRARTRTSDGPDGGDGRLEEPFERLLVDFPEEFAGVVTQKLAARGGRQTRMVNHGSGRVLQEFTIPARGLLGFRSEFLSDTRGAGILNQRFEGYGPWHGEIPRRGTGSLVADRAGRCTAWAIEHLQHRGTIFVEPGDEVYEGMIVGENSHANDLEVNVVKHRPPETAGESERVHLIPPRSLSLEQAFDFLHEDELIEVTPRALRLRKRVLQASRRRAPGPG